MEKLLDILMDIDDSVDYKNEKALIDDHILDSLAIITLVADIEDTFDVSLDASCIIPENFNSVDAMWAMIQGKME